jgi:hypothetical protein
MQSLYDKTGRQIKIGDVLKVYHFTGARRKRHYMYKHVIGEHVLGKASPEPFLKISHLSEGEGYYSEIMDGRVLPDYEIVQGAKDDFSERPRIAIDQSK